MLDSRSQWVVGSDLLDCWSSIHRLHWSASGVESVAVGFRVRTNKLLPDTIVLQTGCPFCSIHWNWYCLVTMVLELLQTVKLELAFGKLHWNSTTTETKENVFIRYPAASHTIVKLLILTGIVDFEETMARAMSPSIENSMVLPRSLTVIWGHDCDCTLAKDNKANNKIKQNFYFMIHLCLHEFEGS